MSRLEEVGEWIGQFSAEQRGTIPNLLGLSQLVGRNRWETDGAFVLSGGRCGFADDAELFHAGFKRCRVEAEDLGGALFAAHTPIGLFEYVEDMLPFNLFECG